MATKTLVNMPADAVTEAIDGLLLTRPDLLRLDAYPHTRVVARRGLPSGRVAVVSGGGAGHEPAHCGLVGAGMLAAAVSGDVFASPSTGAVAAALRHCASPAGVLLVVKNYTGDRLAFGAAAALVASEGLAVETVYVGDDAAVDGGRITGRRGLAGTVLVHKVAGALADAGAPLGHVAAAARAVAAAAVTVGLSLTTCSLPGQPRSTRLDGDAAEIGLGIHGEPGCERVTPAPTAAGAAAALVSRVHARLRATRAAARDGEGSPGTVGGADAAVPVAVLVNNLGGLSNLELQVLVRAVHAAAVAAADPPLRVVRLLAGALMTSLDARGASVTVLPLDGAVAEAAAAAWRAAGDGFAAVEADGSGGDGPVPWAGVLRALDAPAPCTPWPHQGGGAAVDSAAGGPVSVGLAPVPAPRQPRAEAAAEAAAEAEAEEAAAALLGAGAAGAGGDAPPPPWAVAALAGVRAAATALAAARATLNALDAASGDGDAGNTAAAIASALAAVAAAPPAPAGLAPSAYLSSLWAALAVAVGERAGGSSGVLYALMLAEAASANRNWQDAAGAVPSSAAAAGATDSGVLGVLAEGLDAALRAATRCGGAREGDRTMLDALWPVARALRRAAADAAVDGAAVADAVSAAAAAGARATAAMPGAAGRASYVNAELLRGHEDPGAHAAALWVAAAARAAAAAGSLDAADTASSSCA